MNANGRVNILDPINSSVFQLYDKIPIDEKTTSYRDALTGNIEDNKLSKTFFSSGNICLLYTSPSPRDRTRSRMPSSA